MRQRHWIIASLAIFAGLAWTVASFDYASSSAEITNTAVVENHTDADATLLAGRYHSRTRANQFFQRSANGTRAKSVATVQPKSEELAGRYHSRTRTARFFLRATA